MEEADSVVPVFSFRRFALRSLLPNLVLLSVLLVIIFWCKSAYADTSATRVNFLVNLIAMVFAWIYAILLAIFSVIRFSRRQYMAGLILLGQFFLTAFMSYWLFVILSVFGFAYAMKGH